MCVCVYVCKCVCVSVCVCMCVCVVVLLPAARPERLRQDRGACRSPTRYYDWCY